MIALRTVGMRRSSSRSGRTGIARALRRSVGQDVGQQRRSAAPSSTAIVRSIIHTSMIVTINICNSSTLPAVAGDPAVQRPVARAVGPARPRPAGAPGALARRPRRAVRHRPRHDAHGAVADGRRPASCPSTATATGSSAGCSSARRPRTSAGARRRARGTARGGSPSSPRRGASIAERRAFRTHMANLRMGELRPGHVDAPGQPRRPDRRRRAGRRPRRRSTGDDPAELAGRLWPLRRSLATARGPLDRRLDATPRRRSRDARAGRRCRRRSRSPPRSSASCAPSRCCRPT